MTAKIDLYSDTLNKLRAEFTKADSVEKLAEIEAKIQAFELKEEEVVFMGEL